MGCHSTKACDVAQPSAKSANGTLLRPPANATKDSKPHVSMEDMKPKDLLKCIFEGMDTNGDGKIDMEELSRALQKSDEIQRLFGVPDRFSQKEVVKGKPHVPAFFTERVVKMDVNGDGKISFEEFEQHFFPKINGQKDSVAAWAALWKTFNEIDADHDGELDMEELNNGLRYSQQVQRLFNNEYYWCNRFGPQAKLNAAGSSPPLAPIFEDLFERIDTDGNGKISWNEFATFFRSSDDGDLQSTPKQHLRRI